MIFGLLVFFFSFWKQGQNCDCDGVRQPRGPVWLHLWQEKHLWAGGETLLQTNCVSCALLPPGGFVFIKSALRRSVYRICHFGELPALFMRGRYVGPNGAALQSDTLLRSLFFFRALAPPELHNGHYSLSACCSEQGRCEKDAGWAEHSVGREWG